MIGLINLRMLARLLAVVAIVAGVAWWHHRAVVAGRDEVQAQDAVVLAQIQAQNLADVAKIQQLNRDTRHVYEEKLVRSSQDNIQLRADLANVRVCLTEPSHRRPLPGASQPAAGSSSTPSGGGFQPTIAGDLVTLIGECQDNTDKLIALQRWVIASTEH